LVAGVGFEPTTFRLWAWHADSTAGQRDQNPLQSMWTAMWPIIMRSSAH